MILIWAGILCCLVGLIMLIYGRVALRSNIWRLKAHPENPEFAILIPARFESSVIENLFLSLRTQTVKVEAKNVYVIVETLADPTVKLAKKYGHKVIVREETKGRERKGYALDEAIKQILECRRYDLYFIFDADNILAPDYLERMLESYVAGFEIVTGYRSIKNSQPNAIATSSVLMFSLLNSLSNHTRTKCRANVVFSGTGCFVDGRLIDKWQGWPFHSLTEDYELSLYATWKQLATFYNERAVFYDEQPVTMSQSFLQRVRWIRGYFDARKIYLPKMREKLQKVHENHVKSERNDLRAENCTNVLIQQYSENGYLGSIKRELIGVTSLIWLVFGVFLLIFGFCSRMFYVQGWWINFMWIMGVLLMVYLVLMCLTIVLLKKEEKFDLPKVTRIKAVFYNPIFLLTFIPCALKAILAKDVEWTKINHGEEK